MTIDTQPSTALATPERRELTEDQLKRRLQLSRSAGYGLQQANPAQLEVIFLLCRRYGLDPLTDLTLYDGKPFVTIDGRVRLMRRHPEYRGYACRPLTQSEKELWGYEPSDIVIECTIRTSTWGEISARGKVSRSELEGKQGRSNPVARVHPVEMAEKRAIARAERAAFGQDAVLDEEEAEIEAMEQRLRTTPEVIAQRAQRYEEIYGPEDQPLPAPAVPAQPPETEVDPEELAEALEDNRRLLDGAESVGVKGRQALTARKEWSLERILGANAELRERIASREDERETVLAGQAELPD
jgi:hypothetical protein